MGFLNQIIECVIFLLMIQIKLTLKTGISKVSVNEFSYNRLVFTAVK